MCRKMGISEQTFYRWKKRFQGMGVAEVGRLRILEENRKLKQLVARSILVTMPALLGCRGAIFFRLGTAPRGGIAATATCLRQTDAFGPDPHARNSAS